MKRLGQVLLVVFGVAAILFGLLFVLGSAGKIHRFVVAGVSMALGAVMAGFGIRAYKRAGMTLPGYIRAEILDLANRHNGEISEADIQAKLGQRFEHAEEVLKTLRLENICKLQKEKGEIYYVFTDMLPRLTVRRCEFCGAELPLDEELSACPNCGGAIATAVEQLSVGKDEFYSMDE